MPETYFERIAREAIEREHERKKKGIPIKGPDYSLDLALREKVEKADWEIRKERGYYTVYKNGKSYGLHGDTYSEAQKLIPS